MDGTPLNVTVMMFAQLREITGADQVALTLPAGSRLSDVWAHLVQRFPRLEGMESSLAWAANHSYVKPDYALNDGDMIAALPPISGGTHLWDPRRYG